MLWRLATLILLLAAVAAVFLVTGLSQAKAAQQWREYVQSTVLDEAQLQECLHSNLPARSCADAATSRERDQDLLRTELTQKYRLAAALRNPLAAGGVVLGLAVSLPGLLILAGLAAVHVAGEWSTGTVRHLLSGRLRGWQFLLVKAGSLWLILLAGFLVTWAALVIATPVISDFYAVPPIPPGFSASDYLTHQLLFGLPALGVFSILGVTVGVWVRNPTAMFSVFLLGIFGSAEMTFHRLTVHFSPAYWLSGLMQFRPEGFMSDHVWVDEFPVLDPDVRLLPTTMVGVVGGATLAAVCALLALWRMHSFDVE